MTRNLNLAVGDVVRARHARWPEGSFIEGPIHAFEADPEDETVGGLYVCGMAVGGMDNEDLYPEVTVISRALKSVYLNSARTEYALGDVVGHRVPDRYNYTRTKDGQWRDNITGRVWPDDDMPLGEMRLLIDGTTGKVVPE